MKLRCRLKSRRLRTYTKTNNSPVLKIPIVLVSSLLELQRKQKFKRQFYGNFDCVLEKRQGKQKKIGHKQCLFSGGACRSCPWFTRLEVFMGGAGSAIEISLAPG